MLRSGGRRSYIGYSLDIYSANERSGRTRGSLRALPRYAE
jgi:hypothetical protein